MITFTLRNQMEYCNQMDEIIYLQLMEMDPDSSTIMSRDKDQRKFLNFGGLLESISNPSSFIISMSVFW